MIEKPNKFDGGENDPLIKTSALNQWDDIETLKIPSRFQLFIPEELNALEAAIFYLLETNSCRKNYIEIVRCLQWEIRKEQERIALCRK